MRGLKKLAIVALSFVGLCLLALPLRAQNEQITITNCSNDAALRAATSARAVVQFDCGHATIALQAPLLITDSVTIDGGGIITLTGSGITHHFVITRHTGYLRLENIVLTDGYAPATAAVEHPAGSIWNRNSVQLENVTLSDNRADHPSGVGGIYNRGSLYAVNSRFLNQEGGIAGAILSDLKIEVDDSLFADNRGSQSGAILNQGIASIHSTVFRDNQSAEGSGAYLQRDNQNPHPDLPADFLASGDLYRLTFAENSGKSCGAIELDSAEVSLTSSTISTNTASAGGAVCLVGQAPIGMGVFNLTISGNRSLHAALTVASPGRFYMRNVTIANNTPAAGSVGGIHVEKDTALNGTLLIIAGNGDQNCSLRNPARQFLSYSVLGDQSCNFPPSLLEQSTLRIADPLLDPLADNGGPTLTHLPQPNSPARVMGGSCEQVDQRGVLRWAGTCDAGSVEVEQRDQTQHLPLVEILDTYPTPTPTALPPG